MTTHNSRAIAIVGLGAILPEAPNVAAFWSNIVGKRYCIAEVPPERWSISDYYDPDPTAPDKTYSKIGGWVRGFEFDWKQYRMPPRVAAAMDQGQQWAVTIAAQALADYGYPKRPLDLERTGVIMGTAMGGEMHYLTALRVSFPEYANALQSVTEFSQLPQQVRQVILNNWHKVIDSNLPPITEDSMPGELANIISGRVANLLNLRGPNFVTDAACAASFAAIDAAVELLSEHHCDAIISGGVDHNMGVSSFVKFCKIGALSATGSRPFGDGADGFVMGEGSAAFLLKRLADAEHDGDKIYAVIRGVGGSSDGKGKAITAPNPAGQVLAISRAWENAGLDPATATLVEAHGTSTKVGDVVEVESLARVFGGAEANSIALGSVKSNIGHLKAGAGAAGLLKATLALHHQVLPPTLNAEKPNPNLDFKTTSFYLNHEAREWPKNGAPRRVGVSAYGFGGTNFHCVLEEHVPGMLTAEKVYAGVALGQETRKQVDKVVAQSTIESPKSKIPVRGILALGAQTAAELKDKLDATVQRVQDGWTPAIEAPLPREVAAPERLVIDFGAPEELIDRLLKAQRALGFDNPAAWKALQAQGVFRGSGTKPGKIAFLFPGQGSQYLNMGHELAALEPIVARTFQDGDEVMTPILGRSLSSYFFVDSSDPQVLKQGELALMQTAITQPAMLTIDTAFFKLLGEYGFNPDMVMGHSLGEYAALIAAGVMPFADALEATAARGAEMTKFSVEDNGWMAAVMAPLEIVEQTLREIDGYVVAANINSNNQSVIGGASKTVEKAIDVFNQKGFEARRIPVSHAFHTRIVAPAGKPLREVLNRLRVYPPQIPIIANVNGETYPTDPNDIRALLEQQVSSPVQWVKGLNTLYANGVRTFVEVGPKKALKGFVDDVLGSKPDVVSLFTNHPKMGELPTFNQALCGLYAAGYGIGEEKPSVVNRNGELGIRDQGSGIGEQGSGIGEQGSGSREQEVESKMQETTARGRFAGAKRQDAGSVAHLALDTRPSATSSEDAPPQAATMTSDKWIAHLVAQAVQQMMQQMTHQMMPHLPTPQPKAYDRNETPVGSVVISGTGLGLPGAEKSVMDPDNALRILRGEQFVDLIPERFRTAMLKKRITRLVKSEDGSGHFEPIADPAEVIRLAGRPGRFDLHEEYGVPEKLIEALDITTQLAMAAGLDALREAGLPLVQTYRLTTTGKFLPDRWSLPEALRDETGVIFASAFPGGDRFADELTRYYTFEGRMAQLEQLEDLRRYTTESQTLDELNRRILELRETLGREPYVFDRRFLFRLLSMGHSQFAEYVGARGPNTQVNAACASTAQAIALAEDWIRSGRCRRVVVIGADDATSDRLMEWIGAGFLASGAGATDDRVEEAALPFDRRRHGTLIGMGACALVIESEDAVRERGMRGLVELLASEMNNSAFHGTRLDVEHIAQVMNNLLTAAERRFGLNRLAIAPQTVFMSHETFTPARGGSASAEVAALRRTFGPAANDLIVANTKGFTGHPMGVGIEDVIAVKILEYGIVPPVPNHREIDSELGTLNFSRGGRYNVQYAIHLAAGFGSQIAMTFTRRIPGGLERVDNRAQYLRWLADVTGYDRTETEVVKRVLRVVDQGTPVRQPAPSSWQAGTGPIVRATAPGDGMLSASQPAPWFAPVQAPTPSTIAPMPEPVPLEPFNRVEGIRDQGSGIRDQEAGITDTMTSVAPDHLITEAPAVDVVKERILAIVAEKTGYPPDMLDLDLDLEADLGVDTVKQAETFAAIRGEFDIPRRDDLKLRDYPTLNHVIAFVYEMRPDLKTRDDGRRTTVDEAQPATPAAPTAVSGPSSAVDVVKERILAIVAEKTGYPPDMLDLDLDLEADLGVDTVKQAETFAAIRGEFNIPRRDDLKLRDYPTLNHVIAFVYEMRPDLKTTDDGRQTTVEATPTVVSGPSSVVDVVKERILAIVAEKTGYPPDMLDLDLDLEADLGVDTVKQAETFAAIRGEFDIPRRDDLKLRDYPTLNHVIAFVYEMRPDLKESGNGEQGTGVEDRASQSTSDASRGSAFRIPQSTIEDADKIPRRVPVPVLRPMLDLCKATSIALDALNRVIVMMDNGGVGRSLVEQLQQRGVMVLGVEASVSPAALHEQIETWLAAGPIDGVYWLPALDVEPEIDQLEPAAWCELNQVRVKNLYTTMRALYDVINRPGTFLIAATRLGGLHGYDEAGATAPLGGAVVGFVKAYKRERGEVLVKAVDFAPDAADVAEALIAETLRDPGIVEVGYHADRRFSIALAERSAVDGQAGMTLDKNTVFVVTGAAGGITSAIVSDLAATSGGVFYLLDLVPAPEWSSAKIKLFRSDKEALKQKLIDELKAAGEKPTPVKVEKQLFAIERAEAALRAMEAVQAAGGVPVYHSVNLLDAAALANIVDDIRQRYGRIDVLLHAGGVEVSRSLADKEPQEFDLVFDVKTAGLFNILHAAKDLPIGAIVSFSSVAGRFGNAGQTDYSAANDLLCKITSNLRRTRPDTRAVVIDWTAWGGIGMATRGSIPKIMELAGIDLLPPEVGVPTIRRELTRGSTCGEIVVAGRLGLLLNELDDAGGLDAAKVNRLLARSDPPMTLIGLVKAAKLCHGLEIETTLDPNVQPFLFDHRMEGVPLLPGVMGVEAFAQVASLVALGDTVAALENVQFASPFKFYRLQPRTLYLSAVVTPENDDLIAHTILRSITPGPKPELPSQEKAHFRADVRLTPNPIAPQTIEFTPPTRDELSIGGDQIYRVFFHGPAYQVLERVQVEAHRAIGLVAADLPPNASPADALSIMAPRLIEACFQTAGVWKIAAQRQMALPLSIERVITYRQAEEVQGRLYAIVNTLDGEFFDAQVVDEQGQAYVDLRGYRTVALPGDVNF